jgi:hypothetical protein
LNPIAQFPPPPLHLLPGGRALITEISIVGADAKKCELDEGAFLLENILHSSDLKLLKDIFESTAQKVEVSALGLKKEESDLYLGSQRVSLWAPELSEQLYQLLLPFLSDREFNNFSRTDFWQQPSSYRWKPIGLSPLLRIMSYPPGAQHLPHYDAAYFYPDARYRSLMSVLFYLSTHEIGGATRILKDGQDNVPENQRIHQDRNLPALEEEVLLKVQPKAGSVFLFDHRLYHDAEPCNEERMLIRTDLVFEVSGIK